MSNFVFTIAKGAVAEKVRLNPSNLLVMLLKTAEPDTAMKTRASLAEVLAHSVEADFTGYARKTGLTGAVTYDLLDERVVVTFPDQVWAAAGGPAQNTLAKLVVAIEATPSDLGRIPLAAHDLIVTTDGSDLAPVMNGAGWYLAV